MRVWMRYSVLVELDMEEEQPDYRDDPDGNEAWDKKLSNFLSDSEEDSIDYLMMVSGVVDVEFRNWDFA